MVHQILILRLMGNSGKFLTAHRIF
jgi:hypothetical protein